MSIAFDAVSSGGNSGSTITVSHVMSSTSGGVLYSYIWANTQADSITGVTAGGVSMTRISTFQHGHYTNAGTDWSSYVYALASPPTGTISVVATITGGPSAGMNNISYTGAAQTGLPNSVNFGTSTSSPVTASTTVVGSNAWTTLFVNVSNNSGAASTGSTLRNSAGVIGGSFGNYEFDSNGTVSSGSHNMLYTVNGPTDSDWTMISVGPFVPPAANGALLMFM